MARVLLNRHYERVVGDCLGMLRLAVADAGSAGVAAVIDGDVRVLVGDDEPVPVQSVTKLVVALGTGAALSTLGDPVEIAQRPLGEIFEAWVRDERSTITIDGLLGHVAGLRPIAPHVLEAADDPTAVALDSQLDSSLVGTFSYNNAGLLLVAEAIRRVTGKTIDIWLDEQLFSPLGIIADWLRAPDGTALAHGGLIASARDLALIAEAAHRSIIGDGLIPTSWVKWMVDRGRSAYPQHAWVHQTVTHALVASWRAAGVDDDLVSAVGPIGPRGEPLQEVTARLTHDTLSALGAAVFGCGQRICEVDVGPVIGWGHDGDGSQWLIVAPEHGAGIAHTRSPENCHRAPSFFPPGIVLDCL